jgi:phosphoribosylamine--glycine ligase
MTLLDGGHPVLLESFLDGPEMSLFCLVDGLTVVPLLPAQDFKRVGDGDIGPNTGGMGAYTPLPWSDSGLVDDVVTRIVAPVVAELDRRGVPFNGLLYAGIALTSTGPQVVEFNARFGDPETQAVLALLRTPLATLLNAAATGTLAEQPELDWAPGAVVSAGGRVLSVIGTGEDLAAARAEAYRRVAEIKLPGSHYRSDIGLAAVEGRVAVPAGG